MGFLSRLFGGGEQPKPQSETPNKEKDWLSEESHKGMAAHQERQAEQARAAAEQEAVARDKYKEVAMQQHETDLAEAKQAKDAAEQAAEEAV